MAQHYPHGKNKVRAAISFVLVAAMLIMPLGCHDGNVNESEPAGPVIRSGFSSASWVIKQITAGIFRYLGSDCAGWLLSFVGGDDTKLSEAVDDMDNKLDTVISELKAIEAELGEIMKAIEISTDKILAIETALNIAEPQNVINNTYENMTFFTSDMIGTQKGKDMSQDAMEDILSTARSNIDQQVYDIYSGIMGLTSPDKGGALKRFTTLLVDYTGDGGLLERYKSLEAYFRQLVLVQAKGLSLMAEALHCRDNQPDGTGIFPTDFPGTAQQWLDEKFTPFMEKQVEEFLRCTERLVLAECDLRTRVDVKGSFLPSDAAAIFKRADFIAAQISPARHSFGAVARVIGEPKTVAAIIADYHVQANTHNMEVVKLGIDPDEVDVLKIPVEKWNHWPEGYSKHYLEWAWDTLSVSSSVTISGFIKFSRTQDISVAKLCLPDAAEAVTYKVKTTFPHETAEGSLTTCECDGDMSCVSTADPDQDTTHIYGHTTLAIRHRPHLWWQYEKYTDTNDYALLGTADADLNSSPPYAKARVDLVEDYWGLPCAYYIESGIALPLVNGDNTTRTIIAVVDMESRLDITDNTRVYEFRPYVYFLWLGGGYEWPVVDKGNKTYGKVTLPLPFAAGGTWSFYIKAVNQGSIVNGAVAGDYIDLRAWPHYFYLYYSPTQWH